MTKLEADIKGIVIWTQPVNVEFLLSSKLSDTEEPVRQAIRNLVDAGVLFFDRNMKLVVND